MLNTVDKECIEALANKYYSNIGYAIGKGKPVVQTIFVPTFDKLKEEVKDIYPEYYSAFANVTNAYLEQIEKMYSEEKKPNNKSAQLDA